MTKTQKTIVSVERRLRACGVAVHKSPSGTRYAGQRACQLRLADHELGYADYGSRKQSHSGPEVIVEEGQTPAQIMQAAIDEVRDYSQGWLQSASDFDRRVAAELLRGLRTAIKRAAK